VGIRIVGAGIGGIMLNGLLNPPRLTGYTGERTVHYPTAVTLPVNARAATLAFLHATGFAVENNALVGMYTIIYADGQKVEIPLRYGREIRALEDNTPTSTLSTAALPMGGQEPVTLRLFRWQTVT